MKNFGDQLYNSILVSRKLLFAEGEHANLSFMSLDKFIRLIKEEKEDKITLQHPVGYKADNKAISSNIEYTKEELISKYQFLAYQQLPLNGLYQLVTITETHLNYILKSVLIQFPGKISKKRQLNVASILSASSLEEIKLNIVEGTLNEIAYKSPKDYAEEFNNYTGVNLLEEPAFHQYIELKATRDIHIHNGGYANDIYRKKASTLSRVKSGEYLPVDLQYFLKSYECCLQLNELLEKHLLEVWPSPVQILDNQNHPKEEKTNAEKEE